jgi:poly(3-hydroxybutyrate) depolymerase
MLAYVSLSPVPELDVQRSGAAPVRARFPICDALSQLDSKPMRRWIDGSFVEGRIWAGRSGPDVVLYSVIGGGHSIPHPRLRAPRIIGPSNPDINGPREIWAFFEKSIE